MENNYDEDNLDIFDESDLEFYVKVNTYKKSATFK